MIKSRCGIDCNSEECKQAFNVDCAGCINIENPFWGNCPVKDCCEEKDLKNCGLCEEFPCELLNSFSYDLEHGDNGERLERCREWCKTAKSIDF